MYKIFYNIFIGLSKDERFLLLSDLHNGGDVLSAAAAITIFQGCIFRKNCASVPEERSAIPLQTEQSSAV